MGIHEDELMHHPFAYEIRLCGVLSLAGKSGGPGRALVTAITRLNCHEQLLGWSFVSRCSPGSVFSTF